MTAHRLPDCSDRILEQATVPWKSLWILDSGSSVTMINEHLRIRKLKKLRRLCPLRICGKDNYEFRNEYGHAFFELGSGNDCMILRIQHVCYTQNYYNILSGVQMDKNSFSIIHDKVVVYLSSNNPSLNGLSRSREIVIGHTVNNLFMIDTSCLMNFN